MQRCWTAITARSRRKRKSWIDDFLGGGARQLGRNRLYAAGARERYSGGAACLAGPTPARAQGADLRQPARPAVRISRRQVFRRRLSENQTRFAKGTGESAGRD